MARSRKWTVEHSWQCSACRRDNLGRFLVCQTCGKPKGNEKYDERNAETKPAVTDPKALAESKRGRNWSCSFCRYDNRGDESRCGKCGARPDESRPNARYYDVSGMSPAQTLEYIEQTIRNDLRKTDVRKSDLPPDVQEGFDKGVLSNDQMNVLLGMTAKVDREVEPGSYREPPKFEKVVAPAAKPLRRAIPSYDEEVKEPPQTFQVYWPGLKRVLPVVAAFAAVFLLVGGLAWWLMPWEEDAIVTARSWSRTAELQQRVTRHGESWDDERPASHFNDVCVTRQHGTHPCDPYDCNPHSVDCRCRDVETGESCSTHCSSGGNGFSECEEVCHPTYTEECDTCTEYDTCWRTCPTYDEWCSYDYYEWPTIRTERTLGSGDDSVVWPVLDVDPRARDPQRVVRAETYRVEFTHDEDLRVYEPSSEGEYARFRMAARWRIKVNHAGTVTPLYEEP